MGELSMLDMNSLNAIAGLLRHSGNNNAADVLLSIQRKCTKLLDEKEPSNIAFSKTVKVTNMKNVLVQIPKAVVSDWGLKVGDELEFIYKDGEATIKPSVYRGGQAT